MLYQLFDYLEKVLDVPGAGVFQYISFRAAVAIVISLLISVVFGNRIISSLTKRQVGETIRALGLAGQSQKAGTPTMGGFIIILATLIPCVLLADLTNVYIQLMVLTVIWMSAIGFVDDYIKVFKKDKEGLAGRFKILGQIILGLIVAIVMIYHDDVVVRMTLDQALAGDYKIIYRFDELIPQINAAPKIQTVTYVKTTLTNVPFLKGNIFDYKDILWFLGANQNIWAQLVFVPIVIFIVTAVSNASNLTDGLDGLATGIAAIIAAALVVLAYVSGNVIISQYLNILFIPESAELTIFASCFLGACIGFLWYNSFPAKVFMGDTGSLMIGGVIAVFAFLIRKELLIPLLCGIFLIENLSVVMQVSYFKYTKKKYGVGKRIFRMSPIHHHYQKLGMHESKIVTRFWIVQIILVIIAIATLKLR